jgi:hypothetical protein
MIDCSLYSPGIAVPVVINDPADGHDHIIQHADTTVLERWLDHLTHHVAELAQVRHQVARELTRRKHLEATR